MALRWRSWPVGVAIAASTCGYVGYHAVQEDTSMAPWSPLAWILAVSYTHLDVYKRQALGRAEDDRRTGEQQDDEDVVEDGRAQ